MDIKAKVLDAENRIRKYIRTTPLDYSPVLSRLCNANIYLKLESEQLTGSFKIRGAMNKLLSLTEEQKEKGIITASTGNHGLAVAYGLKMLNIPGIIYLPETAPKNKIEPFTYYDSTLKFYGDDTVKTESFARDQAAKNEKTYISPYNDEEIIAGQGTIGIELEQQLDRIDEVFVPVGGGGLISGIAGYLKYSNGNKVRIYGCLPQSSPVMSESIKAGRIIEMDSKETLSDATVGGIDADSITFSLCKEFVDDFFLVSETEIESAIYLILDKHHKLIEGAPALTVAALLANKTKFQGKNIILLISGSNIGIDKVKKILSHKT